MDTSKRFDIIEKDKEMLVEFLNFAAENTKTKELEWKQTIKFVELLTYMQQVILPKIKYASEPKPEPTRVVPEKMGPEASKEYKTATKGEPKSKAKTVRKKKTTKKVEE